MSDPITEIISGSVRPGVDVEQYIQTLAILGKQKGCHCLRYGRWLESAEKLQITVDWENATSYEAFTTSTDFIVFANIVKSIITDQTIYKVHLSRQQSHVLDAPITELVTFFSPTSTIETDIEELFSVLKGVQGCHSCVQAPVVGDLVLNDSDEKKNVYFAAIGWASLDDCKGSMSNTEVSKAVEKIVGSAELVELHHVNFETA